MLGILILLFITIPLADLFLLMFMSSYIGWQTSVILVIVSGIIGAYLAKRSSYAVGGKIRDKLQSGQVSPGLLSDGAMILFAAGLLLTPGFITDAFGLSLLIPPIRSFYKSMILKWAKKNVKFEMMTMQTHPQEPRDANTVDGTVLDKEVGPTPANSNHGNQQIDLERIPSDH